MALVAADTRLVTLKVTGPLLDDFDAICAAAGITRSEALRQLMRREVDHAQGVVSLFQVDPGFTAEGSLPS